MCNQTVCLIAAELERNGISTVSIILLRSIAEKVGVPRGLAVPYPLGSPLGAANDPDLQRDVMLAAFALLDRGEPTIVDYHPR